jgi:hypothetical protein
MAEDMGNTEIIQVHNAEGYFNYRCDVRKLIVTASHTVCIPLQ